MRRLLNILSSLRLTVVLLGLGVLLIFLGTLAQVHEGTWKAQKLYFQSWVIVKPLLYHRVWPVILPGGYLVGSVLLVNLILAHFRGANWGKRNISQVLVHHGILLALVFVATWVAVRSPFVGMGFFVALLAADLWVSRNGPLKDTYTGKKIGINFTHLGVVMLLLGQLATDQLAEETHLSFAEGETRSYSEASRDNELVFMRDLTPDREEVVSIPESYLADKRNIQNEKLPFTVRIKEYGINSNIRARGPMVDTNIPAVASQGIGPNAVVEPLSEITDNNKRNLPYAVIELARANQVMGTWLVGLILNEQQIQIGEQIWRVSLRSARRYTPFNVKLLKTTHEVYPGTDKPRNFQSRVRIENPQTKENREVDIYMNNPLRYAGLTFYQYQMGRDEVNANRGTSTLQVVKNPSWLTPYFGCGAVGYGLARHFLFYLIAFILKRRTA